MSSAVSSTSAALGRPFLFDDEAEAEIRPDQVRAEQARPVSGAKKPAHTESDLAQVVQSTIKNQQSTISLTPASRLTIRPAPEMVTSGISTLDALAGGLPRGCLTEICGPASSGRTSVMLAALAAATRRGEYCALIDASDALDPQSVAAAGIDLDRLLWVRCGEDTAPKFRANQQGCPISRAPSAREVGVSSQAIFDFDRHENGNAFRTSRHRLEQVLRATDLLLESGGFGLIVLDLGDIPPQAARRIPLTTWFRFRRAVENKPTILLAIEQQPIAGSCSSLLLQLAVLGTQYSVLSSNDSSDAESFGSQNQQLSHAQLLTRLEINAELIRSRLDRKPARSVTFETKTAWAG